MCELFIHVIYLTDVHTAELEKRISELTSSSELVTQRLGRAERALRYMNISNADDSNAPMRRRRSPMIDAAWSDDEEADVCRPRHRQYTDTLPVICTPPSNSVGAVRSWLVRNYTLLLYSGLYFTIAPKSRSDRMFRLKSLKGMRDIILTSW